MLFYTSGQSSIFMAMLAAGLLCGAWYDFTRRVRALLCAGRALSALVDALFALGLCLALALSMFYANRLELRLYALLGAACGAALYLCAVSPLLDWLVKSVKKLCVKICNIHGLKQIFQFFCK